MTIGGASPAIALRFFLPPEHLRPFVTTLYHLEISGGGEDDVVEDWLHPEWANLRLIPDRTIEAGMGDGPLERVPRAVMAGPTSVTTHFRATRGRSWGIGFLPLGWARLTDAPARAYSDRYADVETDPALERLRKLCACVLDGDGDLVAERDAMVGELDALLAEPAAGEGAREARLLRIEEARKCRVLIPHVHKSATAKRAPLTTTETAGTGARIGRAVRRLQLPHAAVDGLNSRYAPRCYFLISRSRR